MKTQATEKLIGSGGWWFPSQASTFASDLDALYGVIAWISFFTFLGLMFATFWFCFVYRRTAKNQRAQKHIVHNVKLEVIWTVLPIILVLIYFWYGFRGFLHMAIPPADAMEIRVTGKKWLWQFDYPKDGITLLNELTVPVGRPVKLLMSSEDVLHSFFVPNFRTKMDVIPNRYTSIWFEATKTGSFQVFCTEYCGAGHSKMLATLTVVSEDEYAQWLQNPGGDIDSMPLDQLGERLYTSKACNTCHSLDGSKLTGPSWKGVFGSMEKLEGGSSVNVDENYLRESIIDPAAKVVAGFQPVMPTYKGSLKDREIDALIEFIKSK